eukprot:g2953.t1
MVMATIGALAAALAAALGAAVPSCTLTTIDGVELQGNTFQTVSASVVNGTAVGCCGLCVSTPNCTHYTYEPAHKNDECRLKSGTVGKQSSSKTATSGVPAPAPAPPTPAPAPTPAPNPSAPRPNIVVVLADDLGWYDTAIHNPASPTPRIAELCAGGLKLEHHHVFRYCSPTRRSLLSGRFPNHITTVQPDGDNLCSDFLPLNLTTLAEKLKTANYTNHYVGKGHLGYQTMDHLPVNRGFDDHVGFLGGSEGYAHGSGDADPSKGNHDMWDGLAPGKDAVRAMYYSANYYADTALGFIEAAGARRRAAGGAHDAPSAPPFFMYYAIQNVHSPYTLPPAWEQGKYPGMWDNTYANMLAMLDGAVGNVTDALHAQGLWNDTLVLFTAE